jgi:hypothetical protein
MSEAALNHKQIPESDFARALDCIESSDPESRREGIARLERIGGKKAYQVAGVLVGDADPVVASTARRICSNQQNSGRLWSNPKALTRPAEKVILSSTWMILDEVFFICRRNLANLAVSSFVAALPKLCFIFAVFAGPFLISDFKDYVSLPLVGLALFVHQIFWRPLAWLSIGKSFIGGFPDRISRQQARKGINWGSYLSLGFANLFVALPFSLVAVLTWNNWVSDQISGFDMLLWFGFWIVFWESFFFCMPMVLSRNTSVAFVDGVRLRFSAIFSVLRTNFVFIGTSLLLYIVIYSSSVSSCGFLGIPLQPGDRQVQNLWYLALLVAADCLIDPFIIGYRILMARLYSERNES